MDSCIHFCKLGALHMCCYAECGKKRESCSPGFASILCTLGFTGFALVCIISGAHTACTVTARVALLQLVMLVTGCKQV